uniref:antA/AntB antirepressor family protein n=1 Tax=Enterocloster clostridioformis TaxID=1531 RepID=UPI002675E208|nr:antA/AntB antirepressor family protein [Enterocloster clostridioformis]
MVYGTELYAKLKPGTVFADWIKRRISECDAVEDKDFEVFRKKEKNSKDGRPALEYIMKLDIAKEMAMLEHNETGK